MRYKAAITSVLLLLSIMMFAQQSEISIRLNGKIVGTGIIKDDSSVHIDVNRRLYIDAAEMDIILNKKTSRTYKTSLQITTNKEEQLSVAKEAETRPGTYPVNLSLLHKNFINEQTIKIFLLQNPANELMSLPSRKTLIAELHFK